MTRDYWDDGPIIAGACTSLHDLDGALTDAVYGQNAMVLSGAALTGPYPAGTPIRPWEQEADYP